VTEQRYAKSYCEGLAIILPLSTAAAKTAGGGITPYFWYVSSRKTGPGTKGFGTSSYIVKVWLARQIGVANAKDTTAKADRAETSEGIFRMKGYGYAMGLIDRKEERTKNKNQIFISFHQSRSTPTSSDPNYLDKPGFDPKACPMTG
jgi:hypothetical protein